MKRGPALAVGPMKAAELLARLQRHYIKPGPMPGGVFLPEVTHGQAGGRRVDALYVGFFSSRGHHLVGHEIKVARSDWLHELDQIDKAEVWASQCHAWYAVAPDVSIIRPEELPHGWGLLVVDPATKTRLRTIEKATVNPDAQPSWTTTHSILKRMDTLNTQALAAGRLAAREEVQDELLQLRLDVAKAKAAGPSSERADRAEALVAEISSIIGVDVIDGSWSHSPHVTLDQLRASFAPWLAAARSSDLAIAHRVRGLERIAIDLREAADSLDAASTLVRTHGVKP